LVLLVDGLDEDTGGGPGSGVSSIAALLPRLVPDGLRVIVSGRPGRALPSDVPDDHPLRSCGRRPLEVSPHAAGIGKAAQRELAELVAAGNRHLDLIGLVTAAGGGLTAADLQDLTDLLPLEIDTILTGPAGRTIEARTEPDGRLIYLLAHETLREQAESQLGRRLAAYRARIATWVDSYWERGWPPDTPRYALSGYFASIAEVDRLVGLATDPSRHDRQLETFGADAAALAEVAAAQRILLASAMPDLTAMARLNVRRAILEQRNRHTPPGLPAVWERLGHHARAAATAAAISVPDRRAEAYSELARVASAGDAREWAAAAEQTAHTAGRPSDSGP
jgi:hypothetical protein